MDLARGVNALEVVNRRPVAQKTLPAIDHEAIALGASSIGMRQSIRTVRTLSLDLVAACQGEMEVARWMADDLHIRGFDIHHFYYGVCEVSGVRYQDLTPDAFYCAACAPAVLGAVRSASIRMCSASAACRAMIPALDSMTPGMATVSRWKARPGQSTARMRF
jgi:hypothetical protein